MKRLSLKKEGIISRIFFNPERINLIVNSILLSRGFKLISTAQTVSFQESIFAREERTSLPTVIELKIRKEEFLVLIHAKTFPEKTFLDLKQKVKFKEIN